MMNQPSLTSPRMAVTTGIFIPVTDKSLLNGNKFQDQARPENFGVFLGLLKATWMDMCGCCKGIFLYNGRQNFRQDTAN